MKLAELISLVGEISFLAGVSGGPFATASIFSGDHPRAAEVIELLQRRLTPDQQKALASRLEMVSLQYLNISLSRLIGALTHLVTGS